MKLANTSGDFRKFMKTSKIPKAREYFIRTSKIRESRRSTQEDFLRFPESNEHLGIPSINLEGFTQELELSDDLEKLAKTWESLRRYRRRRSIYTGIYAPLYSTIDGTSAQLIFYLAGWLAYWLPSICLSICPFARPIVCSLFYPLAWVKVAGSLTGGIADCLSVCMPVRLASWRFAGCLLV